MILHRAARLAVFLAIPALLAGLLRAEEPRTLEGRVEKVFDGDTIRVRLDSGEREVVRFLGIDTPESYARRYGYAEFLGAEASKFIQDQLSGKRVRLAARFHGDKVERDRYRRILAFVYHENRDICALLIGKGLARVYRKSTSSRHDEFMRLESTARDAGLGIWNAAAEKDFYRKQFRDTRNRNLVPWFWDNDREFFKSIICECDKARGTAPSHP